jgi:hypothetical protein
MLEAPTQLIKDCQDEVLNGKYTWKVIWGPPRWGKTVVAGWVLFFLYDGDWEKVLNAIVFNLDGVMHRIENGIPCRQWTRDGMYRRVPGIVWDDFGVHSNKAVTQSDSAFEEFKGGFDALGTHIAVLLTTMLDPSEATYQLASKYSHEIRITSPIEYNKLGTYKYDRIDWKQDFQGHRIKQKKTWLESNTFDHWPKPVYLKYNAMRVSLSAEVFQRIKDKRRENETERTLKMLKESDITLLKLIDARGPSNVRDIRNNLDDDVEFDSNTIVRLKSRNLIIPYKTASGQYKHDVSDLGVSVLDVIKKMEEKKFKKNINNLADEYVDKGYDLGEGL